LRFAVWLWRLRASLCQKLLSFKEAFHSRDCYLLRVLHKLNRQLNFSSSSRMSSPTADRSKLQAKVGGSGGAVRQRRGGAGASSTGGGTVRTRANGVNTGGLWRFYTEDSTGLKM
jgi:hypothetical protein